MEKDVDGEYPDIRRLVVMGICSLFIHAVMAASLLMVMERDKPETSSMYRVNVRRIVPEEEPPPPVEPAPKPREEEIRQVVVPPPAEPLVVDLTKIASPISLAAAENLARQIENADIVYTPVPLAEDAVITPGGGLGSGADTEAGGGNALFGGTGGRGGAPGFGGGTGGGAGGGSGNSRGLEGASGEGTNAYFAGTPGLIPPAYAQTPQPPYPSTAKSRGEEGSVLLKAEILLNGRVGIVEVAQSSGYLALDESALEAVKRWRFRPAQKGREAVVCWVNIPIRFELRR